MSSNLWLGSKWICQYSILKRAHLLQTLGHKGRRSNLDLGVSLKWGKEFKFCSRYLCKNLLLSIYEDRACIYSSQPLHHANSLVFKVTFCLGGMGKICLLLLIMWVSWWSNPSFAKTIFWATLWTIFCFFVHVWVNAWLVTNHGDRRCLVLPILCKHSSCADIISI